MFYNSMFNNNKLENKKETCCFKVVYDVCVTPSYYFEDKKEDKYDNCNCNNYKNKEEIYYNDKKDYTDKKENCTCRQQNRCCCWFRNCRW